MFIFIFLDLHTCNKCGKGYARKMSLYVHNKYDCGKEAMRCGYPNCGVKTTRKSSMKRHMTKHKIFEDWESYVIQSDYHQT